MRALTALAKTINELPVKEFRVSFTVYCASKPCKDKNAKTNELDSHPSTRVPLHALCTHSVYIVAGRLRRPVPS